MKIKFTFFFFFVFFVFFSFAQVQIATTMDGKKVALNIDGTWDYVEGGISEAPKATVDLSDCNYWKNEVDEFTGVTKKYIRGQKVGDYGTHTLQMELRRVNNAYLIYAQYSSDLGCANKTSYLMIKLENGETIKIMNVGDEECEANASQYFYFSEEELEQLMTSPVSKFRLSGTEFYADIDCLLPNYFIDNLKCVKVN